MQSHVKVFHLINAKSKVEKIKILQEHREDSMFVRLVELMTSPEYVFTFLEEPTYKVEITRNTEDTYPTFMRLLHESMSKNSYDGLIEYLNTLDSISSYVYKHVIRGNDLGMKFSDVLKYLKIVYGRRYYSEDPHVFGFPTFPFFVSYKEQNVDYFDVRYEGGSISVTYLDGRRTLTFKQEILIELLKLKLRGILKGYVKGDTYHVTNYYTDNNFGTFTERLQLVEVQLLKHECNKVKVVPLVEVHDVYELESIVDSGRDIICTPDEVQKLDGSHNIYLLQGHRLLGLINERKSKDKWKK